MFGKHETDVLVVGAGPVGLFSALALARKGVKVEVIEEQWRSASRSYALALHSDSLRLLGDLDLGEALSRVGRIVEKVQLLSGRERKAEIDLSRLGGGQAHLMVLPQQALEEVLLEALNRQKVPVHWSHRLAGFEEGPDGLQVRVDRLEKESFGYSVTHTEWVVGKTLEYRTRFLLGADGHRSQIRRRMNLDFPAVGDPVTFAVFEFSATGGPKDLRVVLDDDCSSVLWPLPDGRFRWSFEVKDAEVTSPRVKSRLLVQFQNDSFPHVSREDFDRLLEARAPWFDARIDEIFWSAAIRFEKRRSSSYGTGRVWIVGDAAHLASPVAIRSMNVGLREAKDWADRVGRILRGAGTPESLTEFDELWRREWDGLYGLGQDAKVAGSGDPWIAARAGRIADCIPASGDNLKLLMGQLGIYV